MMGSLFMLLLMAMLCQNVLIPVTSCSEFIFFAWFNILISALFNLFCL